MGDAQVLEPLEVEFEKATEPAGQVRDRPGLGLSQFRFPLANHVPYGLFMGLCNHFQLEYPNRDPVADPTARAAGRPHLYVPGGVFKGSPAGHLVATESATTGQFTCDTCLGAGFRALAFKSFVLLLPASVALLRSELSLIVPDLLHLQR
jgi:hypothetical protein